MQFFNGFGFRGEEALFSEFFQGLTPFSVVGFSKGAGEALDFAWNLSTRCDRLLLLSPAFFHDVSSSFVHNQLTLFTKKPQLYLKSFYDNVTYPSFIDTTPYRIHPTLNDLEKLFSYRFDSGKLQTLKKRGVAIEVFVGNDDKIVSAAKIEQFFAPFATVYCFKNRGHLLQ